MTWSRCEVIHCSSAVERALDLGGAQRRVGLHDEEARRAQHAEGEHGEVLQADESLAWVMSATPAVTSTHGCSRKPRPAAVSGLTRSMPRIHFGCPLGSDEPHGPSAGRR